MDHKLCLHVPKRVYFNSLPSDRFYYSSTATEQELFGGPTVYPPYIHYMITEAYGLFLSFGWQNLILDENVLF